MRMPRWLIIGLCLSGLTACAGPAAQVRRPAPPEPATAPPSPKAAGAFQSALRSLQELDRSGAWDEAACSRVAAQFLAAEKEQPEGKLPAARFNAGLAWQRCSRDAQARDAFAAALAGDPGLQRARVQLALYDLKDKGDGALDATIERLQEAVLASKFQDLDALINLAMLEMRRAGAHGWQACSDDFDCAKINLRRALAIDDAYMPAFNQLALFYLATARARSPRRDTGMVSAAGRTSRLSGQMLDLAALVCSQAMRKNPRYAPIHNTAGLIQVELGNVNSAVLEFNIARELDPAFLEAQMNYAAVNLSFRGYEQAEQAYRQALRLKPSSYEAHLGLALALRGQVNEANWDNGLRQTQSELDRCKTLSADRPEAWYNEAILTQEYKSKIASGEPRLVIEVLKTARAGFETFIRKAGTAAAYSEAVRRSTERIKDIDDMITFLDPSAQGQRRQQAPEPADTPVSTPQGIEEPGT